jgi:hypothetical protein
MDAPKSFRDPFWASLASASEDRYGLPAGLLNAIVTRGERSNNDQVSSAGARTPFQIIPETRDALLKQYGVDAYNSPQNAADAAAILLRDSLKRNKGSVPDAVAEYHGGTNRRNWGPITRSYVQRVTGQAMTDAAAGPAPYDSTYARLKARQEAETDKTNGALTRAFEAYQSGQMAPEHAAALEADIKAKRVMAPEGFALRSAPDRQALQTAGAAVVLPEAAAKAYASGEMPREHRIALERDAAAGLVKMPEGFALQKTEALGVFGGIKEAITGSDRATEETRSLPDWAGMPELNSASWASFKTALGTLMAGPDEVAKIIQANAPGVGVRKDAKGNYIFKSAQDGQEYAYKPGLKVSDIPRVAAGALSLTPAGAARGVAGTAAAAAGTQAIIEGTQAATGGEFNPGDVALAGVAGAAFPLAVKGVQAVRGAVGGAKPQAAAGLDAPLPQPPAGPAGTAAAQQVPAAPSMTMEQAQEATRTAALGGFGSKRATEDLAGMVKPDREVVESAERLGVLGDLHVDHITSDGVVRQLAQFLKSQTGSEAMQAQREGLGRVADRAAKIIDDAGGTADLSALNDRVLGAMKAAREGFRVEANKLYDQVDAAIPKPTQVNADSTLAALRKMVADEGSETRLSGAARKLLHEAERSDAPLTYGFIDRARKSIQEAEQAAKKGEFPTYSSGELTVLRRALREDQAAAAKSAGVGDVWESAQAASMAKAKVQESMQELFGKNLDKAFTNWLGTATKAITKGDTTQIGRLMSNLPADMRQEVMASSLSKFFDRTTRGGEMDFGGYARWWQAAGDKTPILANLPPETAKQLADMAKVASNIAKAKAEYIATGKAINPKAFAAADTLMGKIFDAVKARGITGVVAEVAGSTSGAPGLASALMAATSRNKDSVLKSAEKLIVSPEFTQMALAAGTPKQNRAARAFAASRAFSRFAEQMRMPRQIGQREAWVTQALARGIANTETSQPEPKEAQK